MNGDNPLRPPTVPFVPRSDHLLTRGVSNVAESRDLPDVGRCVSTHDVAKLESAYLWGEIMGDKTSPVRRALCASKVYAHVDRARGDLSDYVGVGGHKYFSTCRPWRVPGAEALAPERRERLRAVKEEIDAAFVDGKC